MATKLYGAESRGDLFHFDPVTLKVHTDPKHPQYDPRVELPVDEALVLSIMDKGVVVPLVVSRDGEDVYVVDGRQRRAAALEANKRLRAKRRPTINVPCTFRRGEDDAGLFELSVLTNEQRRGDSPMERAKKMQRLADFGRSSEQIALVFGCSLNTVKAGLHLLDCAKEVQHAVEGGKVSATVATKLHKLPREEQRKALATMFESGATKGQRAKDEVKKARGEKTAPRVRPRKELEAKLKECEADGDVIAAAILRWALGLDEEQAAEKADAA
jgi:ParB family chromosome partitioning protein